MKNNILLLFILSVSLSFGQKKEVKKAIKLFEAGDVAGAQSLLESNAAIFDQVDAKVLNQKLYLEAQIAQANKNFQLAFDKFSAFKAAVGENSDYDTQIQQLVSEIVNSAIEDNEQKNFKEAAVKLYLAYSINPDTN